MKLGLDTLRVGGGDDVPRLHAPVDEASASARLRAIEVRLTRIGALNWSHAFAQRHGTTLGELLANIHTPRVQEAKRAYRAMLVWTCGLSFSEAARILGVSRDSIADAVHARAAALNPPIARVGDLVTGDPFVRAPIPHGTILCGKRVVA